MFTLKQFQYLITIVEEGTFIAASEKLYIAQSALSRQIKNLEDELGFEIFDRSEKRIRLTPAGKVFYHSIKQHLNSLNNAIQYAQGVSSGSGRTINIAHSSSIIMDHQKLNILEQFCDLHHVEFEVNTLASELQIESLLRGDIDLGLIRPPIYNSLAEVNSCTLYSSQLFVAMQCTDQILSQKEKIHIQELEHIPFVSTPHRDRGGLSYLASNLCLSHGFTPQKAKIRSRKLSQLDLVAHGYGICIVPEEFKNLLPTNVVLKPIEDKNSCSEVKLIWRKDQDVVVQQCIDYFQNFYTEQK